MCLSTRCPPWKTVYATTVMTEEKGKQSVKFHNMTIKMLSLWGNRQLMCFFSVLFFRQQVSRNPQDFYFWLNDKKHFVILISKKQVLVSMNMWYILVNSFCS